MPTLTCFSFLRAALGTLFALLITATAADLELAPDIGPGKVCTFTWPGVEGELELFIPVNYQPGATWPVLFIYHDAGSKASTLLYQRYTKRRDWLLVGLSYRQPHLANPPVAQLRTLANREAKTLRDIRQALAAQVKIDPDHTYLAGIGNGGWLATLVGEQSHGLAGMAIQLAGRALHNAPADQPARLRGQAIYIGIGETDPDFMAAHLAAGFYKMIGARVTLEAYQGMGHQTPLETPPVLQAWLDSRLYLKHHDAASREALKTWYQDSLEAAMGLADPLARYRALGEMLEDPRLPLCGERATRHLEQRSDALRNVPAVQTDWEAERHFRRLLRQELEAITLPDLQIVLDGWQELAEDYPQTALGQRAPREAARLQRLIDDVKLPNAP